MGVEFHSWDRPARRVLNDTAGDHVSRLEANLHQCSAGVQGRLSRLVSFAGFHGNAIGAGELSAQFVEAEPAVVVGRRRRAPTPTGRRVLKSERDRDARERFSIDVDDAALRRDRPG